jgi:prepilin-type N-terminal cleavage/methylation domain-containing protein
VTPGARIARTRAGFTLLELLVSLGIVALVAAAIATPFARTIDSRDRTERVMERTSAVRLTLSRIAEELQGAIGLKGARYQFATVDQTLDLPASQLGFATTAARRISEGPQDPVELVRYRLEPGSAGERGGRLIKDQQPSLQVATVPPLSVVVLENVTAFRVGVVPPGAQDFTGNYVSGSDTTAASLPRAVALELTVDDGSGEPPTYRTVVTLPLAEKK